MNVIFAEAKNYAIASQAALFNLKLVEPVQRAMRRKFLDGHLFGPAWSIFLLIKLKYK